MKIKNLARRVVRRVGSIFSATEVVQSDTSQICKVARLKEENGIVTCRVDGVMLELDPTQYIDSEILNYGVFERHSVEWVKKLVRPGMVVLDVGANFGYYTMLFSQLVGPTGAVVAFEPSTRFRTRLRRHASLNDARNVQVVSLALSNFPGELCLQMGGDTASFHWVAEGAPVGTETVVLDTLDNYVMSHGIEKIDFIKVDIDGHESKFIEGARDTLQRFMPTILIEFMHLALIEAGSGVEQLANQLKDLGYVLQSEKGAHPFSSRREFLVEAMNCAYSVNVLAFAADNYPDFSSKC